jgi:hypothetical protein
MCPARRGTPDQQPPASRLGHLQLLLVEPAQPQPAHFCWAVSAFRRRTAMRDWMSGLALAETPVEPAQPAPANKTAPLRCGFLISM